MLQKRVVAEELKVSGWVGWVGVLLVVACAEPAAAKMLLLLRRTAAQPHLLPHPSTVPSTRTPAAHLQAHKAASEAAAVRQDLAAAQERAERHKAAAAEAAAEAAAAREAEQRLQQQLAGEQRRSDKVRAAAGFGSGLCSMRAHHLHRWYASTPCGFTVALSCPALPSPAFPRYAPHRPLTRRRWRRCRASWRSCGPGTAG